MRVQIYLILKVIKGGSIYIIEGVDNNVVSFELNTCRSLDIAISNFLKSNYNIIGDWLDIRHVNTKIICDDQTTPYLAIFYSSFVPLDFLNENTITYITDYSKIPIETHCEIQSSLRLHPY